MITNLIVIFVICIILGLIIIHLVKVYKKSPCGDCASAKQCQAFSKDKILKAYKEACERENKTKDKK